MVGEQTERQPREVLVPPGRGRHPILGLLKAPPAAAATPALGLPPASPLPTGERSHSLVIFAEGQILVFLLRTVWDDGRLLVEAEHDLCSNKS